MKYAEFVRDPAVASALKGIYGWREDFAALSKVARETREMVAANRDRFPDRADRLICLLDQQMETLAQMTSSAERLFHIIGSAGQASDDSVEEMRGLMDAIHNDLKIVKGLTDESMKIRIEPPELVN